MMTPAQFEYLLDVHGADLRRWPDPERRAAQALLASVTETLAVIETARRLDAALDTWHLAPDGNALSRRIVAETRRLPQNARPRLRLWAGVPWGIPMFWPGAAALGFAFVLGLVVGLHPLMNSMLNVGAPDLLVFADTTLLDTYLGI